MIASLFSLWYISLLFLLISSALFIVSLSLSPFSPSFPPTICRQWRVCGCRQLLKHGHRRLIIDEFFCLRRQASGQPRLTHMHQDLLIHSQGPPSTHTHTHAEIQRQTKICTCTPNYRDTDEIQFECVVCVSTCVSV